jgi:hypothetical protein
MVIRRRPTRRHLRNRLIRRGVLFVGCASLAFAFASIALQHLSPSLFRVSRFRTATSGAPDRLEAKASRNMLLLTQRESLRQVENRPVYPYSVVSGGVRDARELKWMAQHDPVVASHYAGFDYDRARVVRLTLERAAYVSYRVGNKVYFTRHRVSLKKGETVLTDGKITARTRCGNRVEESPQQATSSSEPPAVEFDQPVFPAGIAFSNPAVPFESALLNRPAVGPALPLSLYDPFVGGPWVPITPPPLPGVCGIGKKPTGTTATGTQGKGDPCNTGGGGGGGEVPEPATWLLVASGLALMLWKTRQKLARSY